MDNTLSSYLKRADEILKLQIKKKEDIKKYHDEFNALFLNFKYVITEMKNKYKLYEEKHNIKTKQKNEVGCIKFDEKYNQYNLSIIGLDEKKIVLSGNMGNIYDKKILRNDKIHAHQVVICKNGNDCRNIRQGKYCKFYHDPRELEELLNNDIITEEFYNEVKNKSRNFSNTAWITMTDNIKNNRFDNHMRIFGSKSSLENDIRILKVLHKDTLKRHLKNMEHQIMHDILVYSYCLNNINN